MKRNRGFHTITEDYYLISQMYFHTLMFIRAPNTTFAPKAVIFPVKDKLKHKGDHFLVSKIYKLSPVDIQNSNAMGVPQASALSKEIKSCERQELARAS